MSDWTARLVYALEHETADNQLLDSVDDILLWVARRDDLSYRKLQKKIGDKNLSRRIEEFLDKLIVGDSALGQMFPLSLSRVRAKKRYRQLIRIFHPDRGTKPQIWLNYRAERINKAYQKYNDGEAVEVTSEVNEGDKVFGSEASRRKSKIKKGYSRVRFTYRPNVWRERLGNPQQFQRKVIFFLVVCSLLLVLMVYFSNEQQKTLLVSKQVRLNDFRSTDSIEEKAEEENITLKALGYSNEYVVEAQAKRILHEAETLLVDDDLLFDEEDTEEAGGIFEVGGPDLIDVDSTDIDNVVSLNEVVKQNEKKVVVSSQEKKVKPIKPSPKVKALVSDRKVIGSSIGVVQEQVISSMKHEVGSQSPLPSRSPAEVETKLDVSHYIEQLKRYYELGDSDGNADLYISSGRENDIRGSDKLRKYYRKAFARTSNRKFEYVINSIRQDEESAVVIEGLVDLSYSSKTLLRKVDRKINATFVVLLLKVGKEFKIASFDWEEV